MAILERDNNWPLSTYPVSHLKETVVVATNQTKVMPRYWHIKVAIVRAEENNFTSITLHLGKCWLLLITFLLWWLNPVKVRILLRVLQLDPAIFFPLAFFATKITHY